VLAFDAVWLPDVELGSDDLTLLNMELQRHEFGREVPDCSLGLLLDFGPSGTRLISAGADFSGCPGVQLPASEQAPWRPDAGAYGYSPSLASLTFDGVRCTGPGLPYQCLTGSFDLRLNGEMLTDRASDNALVVQFENAHLVFEGTVCATGSRRN
jgi:hypothetical protein